MYSYFSDITYYYVKAVRKQKTLTVTSSVDNDVGIPVIVQGVLWGATGESVVETFFDDVTGLTVGWVVKAAFIGVPELGVEVDLTVLGWSGASKN